MWERGKQASRKAAEQQIERPTGEREGTREERRKEGGNKEQRESREWFSVCDTRPPLPRQPST
jgi:hypothetical protein